MIVEYIRYAVPADDHVAFLRDYAAAMEPLARSRYSLSFEVCQCVEAPDTFIVRIEWTSAEDHLEGFRGSAEFRDFFARIRGYVGNIEEMRHYRRLLQS